MRHVSVSLRMQRLAYFVNPITAGLAESLGGRPPTERRRVSKLETERRRAFPRGRLPRRAGTGVCSSTKEKQD